MVDKKDTPIPEIKVALPVSFTLTQYQPKTKTYMPLSVIVVTDTGVKAYGRTDNHYSKHVRIYADQGPNPTKDSLLAFATRYHDNSSNTSSGAYGIETQMASYEGKDKKATDLAIDEIINANLAAPKEN